MQSFFALAAQRGCRPRLLLGPWMARAQSTLNAPSWGLPLADGVLGSVSGLLCEVGSRVHADEVVAFVETDKVTVDVRAARSGVVTAVLVAVDQDVKVRQPLYAIDEHVALPPLGSTAHLAERRWARQHEIRLEEERIHADREWEMRRQGEESARARGEQTQFEWQWKWGNSARAQQMEGQGSHAHWSASSAKAGASRFRQRQQFRRQTEAAAGSPGRRSQGADRSLPPAQVQELPAGDLIARVLAAGGDPYACLLLPRQAAASSVRKRYLALALRLHPDKAGNEPRAREAMVAITQARRTIKDSSLL